MYISKMLRTRHDLISMFRAPELIPHPRFPGLLTYSFASSWPPTPVAITLPRVTVEIRSLDYLYLGEEQSRANATTPFRFQQNSYRLWYQIEGNGVLQNLSRNVFGRATPGLLGLMESGQRFGYLHQRGRFECFLVNFALRPSEESNCYWNSEVEGKRVLSEDERLVFENHAFNVLRILCNGEDSWGVARTAHVCSLIATLFDTGLLLVRDEHFPADKPKSLVAMAKAHMNEHYADMHHQDALAERCGVDINYLNILFKRETGMTLYEYLTSIRMEHAKHMLEDAKVSIVDIASRIGYPNSNSFSRAFKRVAGLTPSVYTERHAANRFPPRSARGEIQPVPSV